MNYEQYRYLWPPRPQNAIPRELLAFYQQKGWIAQIKKNGTCTVVFSRGLEVIFKTRHNDEHKAWKPLSEHIHVFQGSSNWNVYVGELIHNKTPGVKNKLYLFDKIVHEGKMLFGMNFEERYKLLQEFRGNELVSVAKNYSRHFNEMMDNLKEDEEGLVLKDPSSVLEICKANANQKWQVKCRRITKNYSF